MDLVYPNERKLFRIAMALSIVAWTLLILGTLGVALLYVGIFFLFAIFVQSGFITHVKGNGIRITQEQYPDLYESVQACSTKVGLETAPEAYLLRTDFFNALATRFLRRHYIVLFTDVVDALQDQPAAIDFYIGHEVGHIHRNHIRWGWVLAPVMWLPVLGSAYRRAEEYTCDRYGNACCDSDEDAIAALSAIAAGDTRWKTLDVGAYLKQVDDTGGFFMSLNELIGEYPWLCKRMAWVDALRKGTQPTLPRRNPFAWLISLIIPSIPGGAVSLIIIIAMIGILAAVALPAYQSYIETAETISEEATTAVELSPYANSETLANVLAELGELRRQVTVEYQANGSFPSDLTDIGFETSVLYSEFGELPFAVYDGGVIAVGVGQAAANDAYFVMGPSVDDAGEVHWYCYGQDVADSVLPDACHEGELSSAN